MFTSVSRRASASVRPVGRVFLILAALISAATSFGVAGHIPGGPRDAGATVTVLDTSSVRRDTLFLGGHHRINITRHLGDTDTLIVNRHGRGHVEISQRGITVDRSDHGGDVVRVGDDVHVKSGDRISGDVVSVGGSVTVDGIVEGDAVSVGGDMILGDSAYVAGDAVSVGGGVEKASSAHVDGQTVQIGVKLPSLWGNHPGRDSDVGHHSNGFVKLLFWIVFYLVIFAFAALVIAMARDRVSYAATYMRREPLITFMIGIFSPLIFLIGFCLLLITIIGIPVALALIVIYPVLIFVGWVVTGYRVGSSVLQDPTLNVRTVFTGLVVTSAAHILAILLRTIGVGGVPTLLLGIIGWAASLMAALIGLGAIIGTRFRRASDVPPPAAPYMPPPYSAPPPPYTPSYTPPPASSGPSLDASPQPTSTPPPIS